VTNGPFPNLGFSIFSISPSQFLLTLFLLHLVLTDFSFPSSHLLCCPGFVSVGKSANVAIVLAQLVVDDARCGLHPFLVPLRSLDDHKPLPGQLCS
jgi:hypothetical protein